MIDETKRDRSWLDYAAGATPQEMGETIIELIDERDRWRSLAEELGAAFDDILRCVKFVPPYEFAIDDTIKFAKTALESLAKLKEESR